MCLLNVGIILCNSVDLAAGPACHSNIGQISWGPVVASLRTSLPSWPGISMLARALTTSRTVEVLQLGGGGQGFKRLHATWCSARPHTHAVQANSRC